MTEQEVYMNLVWIYDTCDWIWENPASTHNYKNEEIPVLIIWSIVNLRRETDACMKIATIL